MSRILTLLAVVVVVLVVVAKLMFVGVRNTARPLTFAVTTQPIAPMNASAELRTVVASPDARHVAWFEKTAGGYRVMHDGKPEGEFDVLSPSGKPNITFSRDGSVLGCVVARKNGDVVLINGEAGEPARRIQIFSLSDDGKHVAYATLDPSVKPMMAVVTDGKPQAVEGIIKSLQLAPDGSHVACVVESGQVERLFDRGVLQEGKVYSKPQFHGDQFVYTLGGDGQFVLHIGQQQFPLSHPPSGDGPTISTDGKHWAAVLRTSETTSDVIVDGKVAYSGDLMIDVSLSDDGRHWAASSGKKSGERQIVVDGKTVRILGKDFPAHGSPIISPDGQHVAYAVWDAKGQCFVVMDGEDTPVPGQIREYYFSPDSQHLACRSQENNNHRLFVDGKDLGTIAWRGEKVFAPGGNYAVYVSTSEGTANVCIDGSPVVAIKAMLSPPVFDSPTTVRFLAADKDSNVNAYTVKIQPN